jgi:hypothetical protein
VLIVSFAVLLPVLALGAIGWVAARRLLRDRRERALDQPAGGAGN